MPQMSPMDWLILSMFFLMIYFLSFMMFYFLLNLNMKMNKNLDSLISENNINKFIFVW